MQMKPLGDHLLVKLVKEEEVTASGIVLPDPAEKKAEGVVVSVGPGKLLKDGSRAVMEVKAGDSILFKKWAGDEVEVDKAPCKIISMDDCLAIIEK